MGRKGSGSHDTGCSNLPTGPTWRLLLCSLLLLSRVPGGRGEARRVIEIFEPFPFTPGGVRLQLQHAQQAVKRGSLSLAIVATDGVVLAGESRLPSPLVVPSSNTKIGRLDRHLAYIMSGISADGRYLVKRARILAQRHWFEYGEQLRLSALLFELSKIVTLGERRVKRDTKTFFDEIRSQPTVDPHVDLETDLDKDPLPARHFGVGFLFAGYEPPSATPPAASTNKTAPASCWVLYEMEPTGIFLRWEARAIGEASERAETMLSRDYRPGLSLAEAQRMAVHIMDTVLDGATAASSSASEQYQQAPPIEISCLKLEGDESQNLVLQRLSAKEVARIREDLTHRMGLQEASSPPPPPSSPPKTPPSSPNRSTKGRKGGQ